MTNVINNNYNSVLKSAVCNKTEGQHLKKMGTQIMKKKTVILNYLADETSKIPVEDQAEKFGEVLEKVEIQEAIQEKILKRAVKEATEKTVFAYDLSDEIHRQKRTEWRKLEKCTMEVRESPNMGSQPMEWETISGCCGWTIMTMKKKHFPRCEKKFWMSSSDDLKERAYGPLTAEMMTRNTFDTCTIKK